MQVTLLPSAGSGEEPHQFLTSYLIGQALAIDAGSLGFHGSLEVQARVRHVLISHSHIDHLASLPVFLENVYRGGPDCVTVHAGEAVLDSLQRDLFNGRVWPDFINLSPAAPFLRLSKLEEGRPVELEGLRITPVAVNHVVPTFGFLVEDDRSAVVLPSDTGPTEAIWQYANRSPHLKAVFLEATFPDSMAWLADVARHLTPALFAREVGKIRHPVRVFAVHIKAAYRSQVVRELEALGLPNFEVARPGEPYTF